MKIPQLNLEKLRLITCVIYPARRFFLSQISLPTIGNDDEIFFPIASGPIEVAHCPNCKYTERLEFARFVKTPLPKEDELPLEKVLTPDCHTIEALANFLGVPKEKTAKALMYTRVSEIDLSSSSCAEICNSAKQN